MATTLNIHLDMSIFIFSNKLHNNIITQTMSTQEMAIKAACVHQSLSGGLCCSLGHDKRSRKKA